MNGLTCQITDETLAHHHFDVFPQNLNIPPGASLQRCIFIMQDGRPRSLFSSLSTRTLSAVPPSSQSYEPLVKSVLTQRTKFTIIPLSFLFTWVLLVAWRAWLEPNGIWTIFYLLLPDWSIGAWAVGVLPLLTLRKSYLKGVFGFLCDLSRLI